MNKLTTNRIGFKKTIVLFVLPFIILISYFIAYYPGCFSPDSYSYLYEFNDSHPVFFLMYIRGLNYLFGVNSYILLNLIFASLLIGRISTFFIKLGFSYWKVLIFSIIFSFIPSTGLMMVTYWKDIIYALAIFYLTTLLIESRKKSEDSEIGKSFYIELLIAMVFIIGSRHNGIITALFATSILIFDRKFKKSKILLTCTFAYLINISFHFVAFNYLGAKKGWISVDHILLRHLVVYLHEGKLDSDGQKLLSGIMPLKAYEEGFSYYTHDGLAFGPYGQSYRNINDATKKEIRKAFFRNVINHPGTFLKSEILVSEILWSPVPLRGSFRITYWKSCGTGTLTSLNHFYKKVVSLTDVNRFPFYTRYIFWSGALNVWIIIILAVLVFLKRGFFYTIPMLPVMGNTFSLFLSVISQDYRYVYPEVLVSILLIPYTYLMLKGSFRSSMKIRK